MNLSTIRIVALSAAFVINTINADAPQDLQLFPDPQTIHTADQSNVVAKIDRTLTTVGKKALHDLLREPTNNINTLHDRQDVIRYLLTHEPLKDGLRLLLTQYAQSEKAFNAGLQKIDSLSSSALQGLYYKTGAINRVLKGKLNTLFKKFDSSPTALAAGVFIDFGAVATSAITHYGMALIAYAAGKKIHAHAGCSHAGHSHKHNKKNALLPLALNALTAVHAWEVIPATINLWRWQDKITLLNALQATLIPVAQQITYLHNIYTLLAQHPEVAQKLTRFKDLEALCTKQCSDQLKLLLNILEANTFTGKPSMFSHLGNILAAHKLLQEVGNELQPALDAIGEVDTYLGLATLMQEYTDKPTTYSFARYTEASTAQITLTQFWHPLLATENIVLNSVTLGKDQSRNILITAPNEEGKTATMRAITLAAWLAQTLGIVSAEECTITPFKHFITSIIRQDNLAQGKSLYRVACDDAKAMEEIVASCKKDELVIIVHDEPFNCTHEANGLKKASEHLITLGINPQVVCLVSSHYKGLTTELSHLFRNMTIIDRCLVDGITCISTLSSLTGFMKH